MSIFPVDFVICRLGMFDSSICHCMPFSDDIPVLLQTSARIFALVIGTGFCKTYPTSVVKEGHGTPPQPIKALWLGLSTLRHSAKMAHKADCEQTGMPRMQRSATVTDCGQREAHRKTDLVRMPTVLFADQRKGT